MILLIRQRAHFKDPGLLAVADKQRFARGEIAVFVDQRAHQLDCLTGACAALQCNARQFSTVEQTALPAAARRLLLRNMRGLELGAIGAFAEHQIMFVHHAIAAVEIGVSMHHLPDPADQRRLRIALQLVVRAALIAHQPRIGIVRTVNHAPQGFGRVILRRHEDQPLIGQFVIVRVGDAHGPVGAGATGKDHRRAHG